MSGGWPGGATTVCQIIFGGRRCEGEYVGRLDDIFDFTREVRTQAFCPTHGIHNERDRRGYAAVFVIGAVLVKHYIPYVDLVLLHERLDGVEVVRG